MSERPILMNGAMVRAIPDGRKTQTRRVIKDDWWRCLDPEDAEDRARALTQCPFGVPGDRLWVRETWADFCPLWPHWCGCGTVEMRAQKHRCIYRADGEPTGRIGWQDRWTPSIHMPRWASRLSLEVVSVRVERLHDISEADARAEGVSGLTVQTGPTTLLGRPWATEFRALWESINGEGSWEANSWLWVVEFKKAEG